MVFQKLKFLRFAPVTIILIILYICLPDEYHTRPLSADVYDCPQDPIADNIVIVVKTGATEAQEKIPALMHTSLRCVKNVLIFSDREQDMGPYHLHEALKDTASEVKQKDAIFEFYRKQQVIFQHNGNIKSLKETRDPENNRHLAAWTLGKYKNIHILERAWELVPDKDWYLFIDADTYIIWSNLLRWLPSLDPSEKVHFGSNIFLSNTPSTNGGSGTHLPKSVMYDLAVTHKGTAARWDQEIHKSCCGDYMLSKAVAEYSNELVSVRPESSGHKPATTPFLSTYWCQPVFTMHNFSAPDMIALNEYERARSDKSTPLTHAELFMRVIKDQLQNMATIRDDWDNWSAVTDLGSGRKGDEKIAAESVEECIAACEADPGCFQFAHDGQNCYLGKAIRLGERRNPEGGQKWRSGWHQARIARWADAQEACSSVIFPGAGSEVRN
ncbi:hypothetical protein TWF694_010496 [Orbilia ellipsospora]|uniref:Glycosyltransferase family 31 protein n=1 Tax=Orbilia ellipsospora TaxID=2528407 RepID=A0AAV9XBC0_9PEZI